MENHIKTQEYIIRKLSNPSKDELIGDNDELNISKLQNSIGVGTSPCIYSEGAEKIFIKCNNFYDKDFKQNQSILIDFNNGGLGNQMSSFASVFSLSQELNLQQMLTYRSFKMLSTYFDDFKAKILEDFFCNPCVDLDFIGIEENFEPTGNAVYMPAYPNFVDIYIHHLDTLRRIFKLKEKYRTRANAFLEEIKVFSTFSDPTFIGIHNRRGDFKTAIKSYGGTLVDKTFFQKTLKMYKELVYNAVFVVVSDDIAWAKENIIGDQIYYSTGDLSDEGVGKDLAILASCNHTIITYGTFGMWGAILSNGTVVAADNAAKDDERKLFMTDTKEKWMFVDQKKETKMYKEELEKLLSA